MNYWYTYTLIILEQNDIKFKIISLLRMVTLCCLVKCSRLRRPTRVITNVSFVT